MKSSKRIKLDAHSVFCGFQTEETIKTAETLLGDLSGFSKFRKDAQELLDELRQWRQEQFDDWTRDITDRISDPKEPLWSVKVDRGKTII